MKKFYMMCTDSATRAVRRSKGSSRLYPVHPWGLSEEPFVDSEVGAAFADRFLCALLKSPPKVQILLLLAILLSNGPFHYTETEPAVGADLIKLKRYA